MRRTLVHDLFDYLEGIALHCLVGAETDGVGEPVQNVVREYEVFENYNYPGYQQYSEYFHSLRFHLRSAPRSALSSRLLKCLRGDGNVNKQLFYDFFRRASRLGHRVFLADKAVRDNIRGN